LLTVLFAEGTGAERLLLVLLLSNKAHPNASRVEGEAARVVHSDAAGSSGEGEEAAR